MNRYFFYKLAQELEEIEDEFNGLSEDSPVSEPFALDLISDPFKSNIEEKKRTVKTTKDLGIEYSAGVANIIKVYNEATDEEKSYWGTWYPKAKDDVIRLSDKYKMPFELVAALVATLSPGCDWYVNLSAAERVIVRHKLESFSARHAEKLEELLSSDNLSQEDQELKRRLVQIMNTSDQKLPGYTPNHIKAFAMLKSGVPQASGPKVSVFYASLLDPQAVENHMVLDGHAMNIWRGVKIPLKNRKEKKSMKEIMRQDYHKAAKILGISTQSLQAITWYIWKSVKRDS